MVSPETRGSLGGVRIIAVGAPPTFRNQVARALSAEPDDVEWIPTVSAAESKLGEDQSGPGVLVLSPTIKQLDAFGLAEFVARSAPGSAVLLVREHTSDMNGLLSASMRAGIRDVIDLSRGGEELRDALQRAVAWSRSLLSVQAASATLTHTARGRVVSVFSSKGGTGKSFLSSNVAAALAKETGREVALVDFELGVGDILSYFGKETNRPFQDLAALPDDAPRDQILQVALPLGDHLWGFASPPDPGGQEFRTEPAGKIIRLLRGNFDYVIIDATASYSDAVLAAFDLSDAICLIAGLDVASIRHLSVALTTLLSLGFPRDRFRVVLNRADSKVGLAVADVERVMKVRVDAAIPSSRLVPTALNLGTPVVFDAPKSPVAIAVTTFAKTFLRPQDVAPEDDKRGKKRKKS